VGEDEKSNGSLLELIKAHVRNEQSSYNDRRTLIVTAEENTGGGMEQGKFIPSYRP
jgi:hypothetical protein